MSSSSSSLIARRALGATTHYGPLFFGALFGTFLSGITTAQVVIYLRLHPKDSKSLKGIVVAAWILDTLQTAIMWNSLWFYLISNFGDASKFDVIYKGLALTTILAIMTILPVQLFYVHRIFRLSDRNYWVCIPIVLLMIVRLGCISASSVGMIRIGRFSEAVRGYSWLVTLGLCSSSASDIIMTVTLAVILRIRHRRCLSPENVIDAFICYTLELGSLTGCASVLALILWLALENHIVFIGLFITSGKLHANCMMAMLNMRFNPHQANEVVARHDEETRRISQALAFTRETVFSLGTPSQYGVDTEVRDSMRYDERMGKGTLTQVSSLR